MLIDHCFVLQVTNEMLRGMVIVTASLWQRAGAKSNYCKTNGTVPGELVEAVSEAGAYQVVDHQSHTSINTLYIFILLDALSF